MPQLQQKERPTPEQLVSAYKEGFMSARDFNDKMRRLAQANLDDLVKDEGVLKAIMVQTIKHLQEGWDNLKQASSGDPTESSIQNLKNIGRAMWGQIQIATAPLNAIGEVSGQRAEQIALSAGASPGLAKVVNIAVDVGTGLIPVGGAARGFAKGVQKIGKQVAEKGAKKAAQEGAKIAAKQAAKQTEAVIDDAIQQGLKAEGINAGAAAGEIAEQTPKQLPTVDDFNKALRKFHAEIKDVTETKHLKDIEKEADKLGIHLDDLKAMVPGQPLTPAQIKAYLKTLDEPTSTLVENARQVLKNNPDAGPMQDRLLSEYFSYTPKFRSAEVEAGRTVKVLDADPRMKSITNMMAAWDPENVAKMDLEAARRTIAEDIVAFADDQEKLKLLQIAAAGEIEKGTATFWTKLRETYVNLLLVRPVTQVRNVIGNTIAAVNSTAERALGDVFSLGDKSVAKRIVNNEGVAQFNGMLHGIGDGLKAYAEAFRSIGPEEASKFDFTPHQIQGTLGRIINVPGDMLRGMDNFFKTILTKADYYAMALRTGMERGLQGGALADYVARRVNLPTQAMIEHAKDFALSGTFQNDLGVIGSRMQKLAQSGPLVYLFPFMKTPMNLVKYAWNRTPGLQLISRSLYEDILAGGSRADMAIGRLTLSNLTGMFFFGLAQQGLITGGGPADPALRRSWLGTKQPYSIAGKEGWVQPGQLDPGTTPLWMIADFAEVMNQLDDPTAEQTATAIILAGTRDIVDKTYWQTIGDVIDLIGAARAGEQPGKTAMQVVTGPMVTAATGGPLVASVARINDPVRRETRTWIDQARSKVPGFTVDLPPMRDGYGDPILPPQALGNKWLGIVSPFTAKDYELDEIKKEGARLQVKLPQFPFSLGGKVQDDFDIRTALPGDQLPVELTAQQRDRWQVIYRNILRHADTGIKAALLDTPEYKGETFGAQRELFMGYLAKARETAKNALLVEDIGLAKNALKAQVGQALPMLQEQDRQTLKGQVGLSLDLLDSMAPGARGNLMKWGILDSGEDRDRQLIEAP